MYDLNKLRTGWYTPDDKAAVAAIKKPTNLIPITITSMEINQHWLRIEFNIADLAGCSEKDQTDNAYYIKTVRDVLTGRGRLVEVYPIP